MKTTTVLAELEQAAEQLGYVVRKEKGNFRGGVCTVDGDAIIMLNKRHIPDVQLVVLADSLRDAPIDTIYLKPAVRDALEDAWDQLDARKAAAAAGPSGGPEAEELDAEESGAEQPETEGSEADASPGASSASDAAGASSANEHSGEAEEVAHDG
jgi:hypothetical protein